jgi:hypothetical protein
MTNAKYAKILVGKNEGKTLFVSSVKEDYILVQIGGQEWEYFEGEYKIVPMYGGTNK